MDKQYVSLAGKPNGELWLVDYRKPEGQTHTLLRAAGSFRTVTVHLGDILCPEGYQDALKISGALYVNVFAGTVLGGTEDCLDINHSSHVSVYAREFLPKGRYVATIKGGSSYIDVAFDLCGVAQYTEFDLGNWSDQSKDKTVQVTLHNRAFDLAGARVRQLHASKPALKGAFKLERPWWAPFFYPVYGVLKKLNLA